MEDDGPFSAGMSQFDVDVDVAFELAEQEATVTAISLIRVGLIKEPIIPLRRQ
jgi:hypothetical protein